MTPEQRAERIKKIRQSRAKSETASSFASEDNILDEGSDIGFWDRFKLKNFGGSLDDQLNYLRNDSDYADYDIKTYDGEIVAKKKNEEKYKKLDPSSWSLPELFYDATDLVSDAGSMAADALGASLGASAGAVGGFGVGAVPGAMAGAAAGSAGAEFLKQTLGKALGVQGDYDVGNMAMAGFFGAAPVGLFGTGLGKNFINKTLSTEDAARNYLKKKNLNIYNEVDEAGNLTNKLSQGSWDAAKNSLENSQGGLLSNISDKVVSFVTGVDDAEKLKLATSFAPDSLVKELAAHGAGIDPSKKYRYSDIVRTANNEGNLADAGVALAAHVDDVFSYAKSTMDDSFDVPTREASQKFQLINKEQLALADEMANLKANFDAATKAKKVTDADKALYSSEMDRLLSEIESRQKLKAEYGVDVAKFSGKFDQLLAKIKSNQTGVSSGLVKDTEKFIKDNFRPKGGKTSSSLDPLFRAKALAGKADTLAEDASKGDMRIREGFFIDPIEFKSIYRSTEDRAKEVLRFGASISEKESVNFSNAAFRDSANQTVREMRDEMYNKVLKNPELKKEYHNLQQLAREVEPFLGSEQRSAKTMMNFTNPNYALARKKIEAFDGAIKNLVEKNKKAASEAYATLGENALNHPEAADLLKKMEKKSDTGIMDYIKLGSTAKMFGDNSLNAVGGNGVTSTSKTLRGQKIGGSLAHFMGLATGVPGIAKGSQFVGETLGGMLTSPRAVNSYLKAKEYGQDVWSSLAGGNGVVGKSIRGAGQLKDKADDFILEASTPRKDIKMLSRFKDSDLPVMNPMISQYLFEKYNNGR